MKGRETTIQILLLTFLLELCTCATDDTWVQIYSAMSRNDNRFMNLKSTCPWIIQGANSIRLVYSHGRCLDLNNITPDGPAFSAYGRCQPIYPPYSCYSHTAVGYTCIQSSRVQLAMGKRDEDRSLDPPFRCPQVEPPEVNVTATDYRGEEIKPIVGNVELELTEPTIPPPRQTVTIKVGIHNVPLMIKPDSKPNNTHHHSSLLGLIFPSYLSSHNAQLRPQLLPHQPLVQRPYGGPLAEHQSPLQRPLAGTLGQRLQISYNGFNRT